MGILSSLVGQFTNFGLDYLNNYLVQKRLEDSMRQSTNYLTGTAIPEAKKATGFQEAMLEGQAPPGAAALLGFTSAPTVREPYGSQAQKFAEAVQYNPQIPEGLPVTPQLQETTMRIAEGVARQPRQMIAERGKAEEEKAKNVRDLMARGYNLLKPYEKWVKPGIIPRNIHRWIAGGAVDDSLLTKDFPQEAVSDMETRQKITEAGGTTAARLQQEYRPDIMGKRAQQAGMITGAEEAVRQSYKNKDINLPDDFDKKVEQMIKNDNPDWYTTSEEESLFGGKQLQRKPEMQQTIQTILEKTADNFITGKNKNVGAAYRKAKQQTPIITTPTEAPGSLRESMKRKGLIR